VARMDWDRVNRENRQRDRSSSPDEAGEEWDFKDLEVGGRTASPGHPKYTYMVGRNDGTLGHPDHRMKGPKRGNAFCSCGWQASGEPEVVKQRFAAHERSVWRYCLGEPDSGHDDRILVRVKARDGLWEARCECGQTFGPSSKDEVRRLWMKHANSDYCGVAAISPSPAAATLPHVARHLPHGFLTADSRPGSVKKHRESKDQKQNSQRREEGTIFRNPLGEIQSPRHPRIR
jgi:hypothetical protein